MATDYTIGIQYIYINLVDTPFVPMFLSWINGHQRASEWPGSAPASQWELATGVGKFRPAVTPGSAQRVSTAIAH